MKNYYRALRRGCFYKTWSDCWVENRHSSVPYTPTAFPALIPGTQHVHYFTPLMQPPSTCGRKGLRYPGAILSHVILCLKLKGTGWPLFKSCPHTFQKGCPRALLWKLWGPAKTWYFPVLYWEVTLNLSLYEEIFPKHHRSRADIWVAHSITSQGRYSHLCPCPSILHRITFWALHFRYWSSFCLHIYHIL